MKAMQVPLNAGYDASLKGIDKSKMKTPSKFKKVESAGKRQDSTR
jgi:hypothetical protein